MPREGHDSPRKWLILRISISIHVPREGHDSKTSGNVVTIKLFQSTCPARGTTLGHGGQESQCDGFQSTCPARGTTIPANDPKQDDEISIHVPREGHDSSP